MVKLVVPIVTPGLLPERVKLDEIPEDFRSSVANLIAHVRDSADTIMPGGTTGEGHLLSIDQYAALLKVVVECRGNLDVRAGVLARDDQVGTQIQIASENGIRDIVLGLNHTGDHEVRVAAALEAMGPTGRLFLYNMPGGFPPLAIESVAGYFSRDKRIVGIKDSSGDQSYFYGLQMLRGSFPGRILSHGSEPLYGAMPADKRQFVDEVTAGTANAFPKLLRQFLDDPEKFGKERIQAGNRILGDNCALFNLDVPGSLIGDYIYGLKRTLHREKIFTSKEDYSMYGDRKKGFFPQN